MSKGEVSTVKAKKAKSVPNQLSVNRVTVSSFYTLDSYTPPIATDYKGQ